MSLCMATGPFDLLAAIDKKSRDSSSGMLVYEHAGSSWTGVLVAIGADKLMFSMRVVRELIIPPTITPVPGVQNWLKGIANLRGTLFPVVDVEQLLGLPPGDDAAQQRRLVVLEKNGFLIGVFVSAVYGMKNFMNTDQVEDQPAMSELLSPYVSKSFQNVDEHFPVLDLDLLMQDPIFNQVSLSAAV